MHSIQIKFSGRGEERESELHEVFDNGIYAMHKRVLLRKAMQKHAYRLGFTYAENNNPTENPKRTTISIKLFNFSSEAPPTAKASPLFIFNLNISKIY